MSTRNCPGMDSVIKPLDTIPEDKKVRVQRTQSTFDPFEKPTNQVKRVHSENNACINFNKSSSAGKESPKVRRHSSPSSVSAVFPLTMGEQSKCPSCISGMLCGFITALLCSLSLGGSPFSGRECAACASTNYIYKLLTHRHPASQWEMIKLIFGKNIFFPQLFPVRGICHLNSLGNSNPFFKLYCVGGQ